MFFKAFIKRIKRRLLHLRLQPIRVFCFHVVSDVFDSQTMWKCDWMSVEGFKGTINHLLSKKYKFISLTDAYKHICEDRVRYRKYAVVTFDDGDSSIMNVMPWLTKKRIPVTLFVNPGILSSDYLREKPMSLLLSDDLHKMEINFSGILSIGNHGYIHKSCIDIPFEEFKNSVLFSEAYLKQFDLKIPFFSYPFGSCSQQTNQYLINMHLVPVLCDGKKNYRDEGVIHREVIESCRY